MWRNGNTKSVQARKKHMSYTAPTVVASGTSFAQFQAGGASGHLEKLITAQGATLAPTVAATATATGGGSSGGLLAAGTYYFVFTETNGFGETTKSPEGSQLTVGSTNQPQFTFPSLKTGNTARNLYLGAVGGSSGGPYTLYASGITTTTYVAAVAAPTNSYAMAPPSTNTTGFTYVDANSITHNKRLELLRACKDGNFEDVFRFLRTVIADFNRGNPMGFGATISRLRDAHAVFALMDTLCSEMGTLIDANPGTLGRTINQIGNTGTKRTWP
jgi:hypothetical protein